MRRTRTALAGTIAALGLLVGACGGGAIDGAASPTITVKPEGTEAAEETQGAAPGGMALRVGTSELGSIITDGEGMTLYRFDTDTAKPPKSNCAGECVTAWPPVLVEDPDSLSAEGVDPGLLGTVEREDGDIQLTVAGWPAYRYSKDTEPGDTKGQGAGGKWFAFTADGKKAQAKAEGAQEAVGLAVMEIGALGRVVTDREGMTLYRFDKDTGKPSKATCEGACAEKWPPLLVPEGAEPKVDGLDKADVGTVERADGTRQVTVGGWPVYRFSGDKVPCDTKGQGAGGTWFAVTPDGKKAGA